MSKRIEYYSATWCQPCKVFGPVMDEFAKSYPDVEYVKYMVDDNPEKALENFVTAVPCVILFENDKQIAGFVGAKPRPYLDKELGSLL